VWETLSASGEATDDAQIRAYYEHTRPEVVAMLTRPPRLALEFGCAGGGTGARIKATYPGARVIGVEINPVAAEIAKTRLDRVLSLDMETVDYDLHDIPAASVDTAILADVLEHLRDPWSALRRLRSRLTPDAQVIASIPNTRNLWLISELVSGRWRYEPAGLLDITHLRFFTLEEMKRMFAETGYTVVRCASVPDARIPEQAIPPEGRVDIRAGGLTLHGVSAAEWTELRTVQFLLDVRPAL
jgi:2-polyprenyl-3-methyl-5-hydroxy-6-metoxy-1,4-benzoquinol methylase